MKQKITKILVFLTAVLTLPLGFTNFSDVKATDNSNSDKSSVSLSVSPAQQRLELTPNSSKKSEITVINSGDIGFEVKVYATPYTVAPDYSSNIFDQATVYSQISRWIEFNGETSFYLEPNQRRTVEFIVNVPASVPAGGQYASIMAETIPPKNATGVVAIRRIASLVLSNIDGETIDKGEIVNYTWRKTTLDENNKKHTLSSVTVRNLGNTDFSVENRLQIVGLFGNVVDEVVGQPKLVFPETERTFELTWNKVPIGIFRLVQEVNFLGETYTETKLIVLLPFWLILILILAIIIISTAIVFLVRRYRGSKKNVRK